MKIIIPNKYVSELKGRGMTSRFIEELFRNNYSSGTQEVVIDRMDFNWIDGLQELANKDAAAGDKIAQALANKIQGYKNIRAEPDTKPIGTLENLEQAIRKYIEDSPRHWVYTDIGDGIDIPVYVSDIEYVKPRKDMKAYTLLKYMFTRRGKKETVQVNWHTSDISGKRTVPELLAARNLYCATVAANDSYEVEMERYREIGGLTGIQYLASGTGFRKPNGYGSRKEKCPMVRDGYQTKVIMDDVHPEGKLTGQDGYWDRGDSGDMDEYTTSTSFWDRDITDDFCVLPVHPYVKVFDLDSRVHDFVEIHVNYLEEYVYDKTVQNKLILPDQDKQLVQLLVAGSGDVLEDIIAGKTGGVIVIATGPPGTGKTLTAEVSSEELEKPLYVVQCGQLGTDEEAIEKRLNAVLDRATRWSAILLIDEADVYIHERGDNIQQNAIVGVFLRVLEYYRGVLFMTSNKAVVIDDAILSRAMAHLRYEMPGEENIKKIMVVLAKQFGLDFKTKADTHEGVIAKFAKEFSHISGRDVKSMLKLAVFLSKKTGKPIDNDMLRYVSQFQDLTKKEVAT